MTVKSDCHPVSAADGSAAERRLGVACALNLLRLHAYWTSTPLDRQRTSHLARLELRLAA